MNAIRLLLAVMICSAVQAAEEYESKVYRQVGEVSLSMRIYKPTDWKPSDSRPGIVFFFGGGWSGGSPDQFHEHCKYLAGRGMVALAADYRVKRRHETGPADSTADAKAAVGWVREKAGKLGIDPSRVAAGGGSAGGHLAAATATLGEGEEVPDVLVLFNPALDLIYDPTYPKRKWNATVAEFKALSPFHTLDRTLPPTVIFHGTKDDAVPFPTIQAFAAKAKYVGADQVLVHAYEGRPHGFFNHGRGDGEDYRDTVGKMDRFLTKFGWLNWTVKTRKQVRAKGKETTKESTVNWKPQETAIIIVDMWNNHHCVSAARRVVELAPHMNEVVKAARERGVFIIHAPSGCSDYYQDRTVRKNVAAAPLAKIDIHFQWNHFNPDKEGPLAEHLEKAGCSCDTPEICGPDKRVWTHQIKAIEMADIDAVSSNGQEIYNLLQQRGIKNVILMGVHTNRCVLGRPFGIRQMVYVGKNVVLCRDLTDSYHREPGKHFEGLAKIIRHVETWWCPTITSESITGARPFRFKEDLGDKVR
ncbi:MAG: alpha/beta hydrolase fold domain-containing protein [Limisphaerales bacterium]